MARVVAAALLIWSIQPHRYDYYTLLRWATCFAAAYSARLAWLLKKTAWSSILAGVALFFNPFIPVHLRRDLWVPIDLGTAVLLLASIRHVREQSPSDGAPERQR